MTIAVIVLTHNRNELLKRCLDSLIINQTKRPDEVIVVRSGSADVGPLTVSYDRYRVPIRVVSTANVSLAGNRNAGLRASASDLAAFTDDDCEVCNDWVESYLRAFDGQNGIGSAGGRTFDANGNMFVHGIEEVSMLLEDHYNRANSPYCYFFCTRNVCYERRVLDEVGLFEGTYRRSFEDVITGIRIMKAGYKNVYHPAITVRHYGRGAVRQLIKRQFEYGRDMRAGARYFADMPPAYILKALRSPVYILLSTFVGPVRDVFRFGKTYAPLKIFAYSFLLKVCVNAGMIYERIVESAPE